MGKKFVLMITTLIVATSIFTQSRHNCSVIFDVISTRTGCGSNDGKLVIIPDLGEGQYFYSIDSGSTYVTDSIFQNLASGLYYVFVKDSDTIPCVAEGLVSVSGPLALNSIESDTSCSNGTGTIEINVSGGLPSYYYSVDNGTSYVKDSTVFRNLTSGNYSIKIQDNIGCEVSGSIYVDSFARINPIIDTNDILCNSGINYGSVEVNGLGGDMYGFSLNGGLTYKNGLSYLNDSLLEGEYSLLIKDKHGCEYGYSFSISAQNIDDSVRVTNDFCDDSLGVIQVFGFLGEAPYEYSIDGGISFQTNGNFSQLAEGVYFIQVKDGIQCISYDTVAVTNFGGFSSQISAEDTLCRGNSIQISVTHNAGMGVSYQWNNNLSNTSSHIISPTASTNYEVILTDIYGCVDTINKYVFVEDQPSVEVDVTDTLICLGNELIVNAIGARDFFWSTGDTGSVLSTYIQGNMQIEVIGKNGKCADYQFIDVYLKPLPTVIASTNVVNANPGELISFSSQGSVSSSYIWDFGDGNTSQQSNPIHIYNQSGVYLITLTGAMGECTLTDSISLTIGTVNVSEIEKKNYRFYPNPLVESNLNIDIEDDGYYSIYSLTGELISNGALNKGNNKVSLSNYKGLYMIEFKINNKLHRDYILIQ